MYTYKISARVKKGNQSLDYTNPEISQTIDEAAEYFNNTSAKKISNIIYSQNYFTFTFTSQTSDSPSKSLKPFSSKLSSNNIFSEHTLQGRLFIYNILENSSTNDNNLNQNVVLNTVTISDTEFLHKCIELIEDPRKRNLLNIIKSLISENI